MSEYDQELERKVPTPVVTLRMPQPMLTKIDDRIDRGEHLSRSEAIRALISKALSEERQ